MSLHPLILIDLQNDFITGPLGSEQAQKIIPRICQAIQNHAGPIYVTLDSHNQDYLATREGLKLPICHCQIGTKGWQLHPQILDALKAKKPLFFEKDTFAARSLALHLKDQQEQKGIDRLTVMGLCTDICVLSNVLLLQAHLPNIPIYLDANCCAGTSPEAHQAALTVLQSCQIEVIGL